MSLSDSYSVRDTSSPITTEKDNFQRGEAFLGRKRSSVLGPFQIFSTIEKT